MKRLNLILTCVCLLSACSCATKSHLMPAAQLPADVTMNRDAGDGYVLTVMLRLKSGQEMPFVIDTGSPRTVFEKSFEPKLGKRLDTDTINNFGNTAECGIYAPVQLYLGDTPLMTTGDVAITYDFKQMPTLTGDPNAGVLGMDTLGHYCIQLDFEAGKMRFLDSQNLNTAELGQGYPLGFFSSSQEGVPFIRHSNLAGKEIRRLAIDTGCDQDGKMPLPLLQRQVREHGGHMKDEGTALFEEYVWDGRTYRNVAIGSWQGNDAESSVIGLQFLARHLVTLDFPGRMMYLKQINQGTLRGKAAEMAAKFVKDLKDKNRLPGWSKEERGTPCPEAQISRDTITLGIQKSGNPSIYYYTVTRPYGDTPMRIQKAWQADPNNQTIEEYPVP